MFLYSDTAPRTNSFQGDVWKMDANKGYMRHYDNLLYLQFIQKEGSFVEKRQATKEIEICKRKLKFWEHHPNYDHDVVRPQVEKKVKEWKGRL